MEVYQSSKTAAEMEYALGAIPSIGANNHWFIGDVDTGVSAEGLSPHVGENGNWFIGDLDTGVYALGVQLEGTAEVGQTIVVKAVDENGKPTEWEAADITTGWETIASGEFTEEVSNILINKDNNGDAFKLTEAYFALSVIGTSSNTVDRGAIEIRVNGNSASNAPVTIGTMTRTGAHNTERCMYEAHAFPDANMIWVYAASGQSALTKNHCKSNAYINYLYIYTTTTDAKNMGVGTKWELKGVRA